MIINRDTHSKIKEFPFFDLKAPRLDLVQDSALTKNGVNLTVLRLDEIHRFIHGNKFFKLKYHLIDFLTEARQILHCERTFVSACLLVSLISLRFRLFPSV